MEVFKESKQRKKEKSEIRWKHTVLELKPNGSYDLMNRGHLRQTEIDDAIQAVNDEKD